MSKTAFPLDSNTITPSFSLNPYIIAEAGVNHEGDLDTALRLIEEAAEGGADCIKFQTYKADKIASVNSPSYWDLSQESTRSQYELFKKYDSFGKREYELLAETCQKYNIDFISTPFDHDSASFLSPLMKAFKLSSSDITNKPLIKHVCSFGKPIILSTGASTLWEIERACHWINEEKIQVSLLHCVLNYPTKPINANLGRIKHLENKFPGIVIGYSDHTLPLPGLPSLQIAAILGAKIIEKHFTHDKSLPGNDHYHAMDKSDLKSFRENLDRINLLIGSGQASYLETEEISRLNARRSIVANKSIRKGQTIDQGMIICKRPGTGIPPYMIDEVLGKRAQHDIPEDNLLQWTDLADYGD